MKPLGLLSCLLLAISAQARPAVKGLSEQDARLRKAMVADPAYAMAISIDASSPVFSGVETVSFVYTPSPEPLTVDFGGGTVEKLLVNGARVDKPDYNGLFITLPSRLLKRGHNSVEIHWLHPYSETGEGLYRFKDPEDGRVYVYTDFEPYNANLLFPCFDQPDLKAPYTLTVDAPKNWIVISTTLQTRIEAPTPERRRWTFPPSPKLSTYVYALHAGPYHKWDSMFSNIPLRLFCRESLAKYVVPDDWFTFTKQGLAFYGQYFGIAYPFLKYDQIIVPDYNAGAMENVGAVTFSEEYIHRGATTRAQREDLAGTLLHEMAHMWFGDLVTMSWWDGLWLNESFAEYMSAVSTSRATEFKDYWKNFFIDDKTWAYDEDERPTTHPIETKVDNTETAFTNFDGITYGKGASTLKQLSHLLGEDAFRDGVRVYLKRRAYDNAKESDFFGALEEASKTDLKQWMALWLNTAGVDTVRADWTCKLGTLDSGALVQTAPHDHPTMRRHETQVGLYSVQGKTLARTDSIPATYDGPRTDVPALAGKPCPALLFPNDDDYDYVRVQLDDQSLKTATARLEEAQDPLLRAMLWYSLWDMVREARWKVSDYAQFALAQLGREPDFDTAKSAIDTVASGATSASVFTYMPQPPAAAFEKLYWTQFRSARPGSDFQKLWFDAFVSLAATPRALQRLKGLLKKSPKGLEIDQDRRWQIVQRLSAMGAPDAPALISAESKRDPSDEGVKAAIAAEAAAPGLANKKAWFARLADPASQESLGNQRVAMGALFPREQADLRAQLAPDFFAALPKLAPVKGEEFLNAFTSKLAPNVCTQASVTAFNAFLQKNASLNLPPAVVKNLRIAAAEDQRCVNARALLGSR